MSKVQTQNISDPVSAEETKNEQQATFRLDALGVSGSDLAMAPPKRRVSPQAAILGVLVLVAAGALFAMRQLGMGPLNAIAEPASLGYELDKKPSADHKKLLNDLTVSHVDHQVPADQVQKNPFRMPELEKPTIEIPPGPTGPQGPDPIKVRDKAINDALATIKVHSVLGGSVPVARINSENVRVGDTFRASNDVDFTVIAIQGREVQLQVDERIYIISIDDEVNRGPAGKRPPVRRK